MINSTAFFTCCGLGLFWSSLFRLLLALLLLPCAVAGYGGSGGASGSPKIAASMQRQLLQTHGTTGGKTADDREPAIQNQESMINAPPDHPGRSTNIAFGMDDLILRLNTTFSPGIYQLGNKLGNKLGKAALPFAGGSSSAEGTDGAGQRKDSDYRKNENRPYPDLESDFEHLDFDTCADVLEAEPVSYTIKVKQTEFQLSKTQVLEQLLRPASQTSFTLGCQDCQAASVSLSDMQSHADTHEIICTHCWKFKPEAGTPEARNQMKLIHCQSDCQQYSGNTLAPSVVNSTEITLRYLLCFGSQGTLLDLFHHLQVSQLKDYLQLPSQYQRTLLHDIFQHGSEPVIAAFINQFSSVLQPEDLYRPDRYYSTPLHYLFQSQKEAFIIESIQSNRHYITSEALIRQNHEGCTLLHTLHQRKFYQAIAEVFRNLIEENILSPGLLTLQDDSGTSLLQVLFACGDDRLIYDFIDHSAPISGTGLSIENHKGETPLHTLFERASVPAIIRLIDTNSIHLHPELLGKSRADDGNSPAHLLFARGDSELTKIFLDSCYLQIDKTVAAKTNQSGISILQALLQHSPPIAAQSWLHQGNPDHKQLLRELFSTAPDMTWPQLLQRASQKSAGIPRLQWVMTALGEPLHETGARPSAPAPVKPMTGLTLSPHPKEPPRPVVQSHKAIQWITNLAGKPIADASGSPARKKDGFTPLHRAARNGNTETAAALVQAGTNPETRDKYDITSLHWAALNIKAETAVALVKAGANPEAQTKLGSTPLHWAAKSGNTETAVALVQAGASPEAQNIFGSTPLHLTALCGKSKTAVALVKAGANPEAQNKEMETPLHLAIKSGNTETAVALVQAGASRENLPPEYSVNIRHWLGKAGIALTGLSPHQTATGLNHRSTDDAFSDSRTEERTGLARLFDSEGNSALHRAAQAGQLQTMFKILGTGEALNIQNQKGENPLHVLFRKADKDSLRVFYQRCKDRLAPALLQQKNTAGHSPIELLCERELDAAILQPFLEVASSAVQVEVKTVEQRPLSKQTAGILCPITQEVTREPVITGCGHVFDQKALEQWLSKSSFNSPCPTCKSRIDAKQIRRIYCDIAVAEETDK